MNIDILQSKAFEYIEVKKHKKALKLLLEIEKNRSGYVSAEIATLYADICINKCKKYNRKEKKWNKKAIKYNSCTAMANLAIYYYQQKKAKKAKKYFKMAIRCGDLDSALDLSQIYLTEAKFKKAKKYLKMANKGKEYETITEDSKSKAKKLLKKTKRRRHREA